MIFTYQSIYDLLVAQRDLPASLHQLREGLRAQLGVEHDRVIAHRRLRELFILRFAGGVEEEVLGWGEISARLKMGRKSLESYFGANRNWFQRRMDDGRLAVVYRPHLVDRRVLPDEPDETTHIRIRADERFPFVLRFHRGREEEMFGWSALSKRLQMSEGYLKTALSSNGNWIQRRLPDRSVAVIYRPHLVDYSRLPDEPDAPEPVSFTARRAVV